MTPKKIISSARELAGDEGFEADLAYAGGPGRFEAVGDTELALAVDIHYLHGVEDEIATSSDGANAVRVGPVILWQDSMGFHDLTVCASEAAAERELAAVYPLND